MSETVTAVPETFSVTLNISYNPATKLHVVADLYRHTAERKFLVDTKVYKTSASAATCSADLDCNLIKVIGDLTAPTTGCDLKVSHKHRFFKDRDIFENDEYGYHEVVNLLWLASHGGRNSVALCLEYWVEMV